MQWYVEIKSPLGGYHAHIFHGERPSEKTGNGNREFRLPPQFIPTFMIEPLPLSLAQLGQFLSPDGEFYGYEIEVQEAVVDMIRSPDCHELRFVENYRAKGAK